jgi:hypothetical protein
VARLQRECGLCGPIAGRGRSAIAPNVLSTAGSAADPACHGRSFLLQLSFSKTQLRPRRVGWSSVLALASESSSEPPGRLTKLREGRLAALVYSLAPFKKNNIVTGLGSLIAPGVTSDGRITASPPQPPSPAVCGLNRRRRRVHRGTGRGGAASRSRGSGRFRK